MTQGTFRRKDKQRIPVYCSHSYRREDREINDYFWDVFFKAGFSFTVDPASPSFNPTRLELMMARSVGFCAVIPFRGMEEQYQCSPFILYEYGLAAQARLPMLVLREKQVPPRYFKAEGTVTVEFDRKIPEHCYDELEYKLEHFYAKTSGPHDIPFRKGKVGIALAPGGSERLSKERRSFVEDVLDREGNEMVDLTAQDKDPSQLAQLADCCDFVMVDLDDDRTVGIAKFLLGRGTPLMKFSRLDPGVGGQEMLLGSTPLRRAAKPGELVTYWKGEIEEFKSRVRPLIRSTIDTRTELNTEDGGHRYFRSIGRKARPVFISNGEPVNALANDLAQALRRENIPFFHYRFENTIGWGERWNERLDQTIAGSKVFVPLIDESYWNRDYCRKEYETAERLAKQGGITIIPMLVSGHDPGIEIPYQGSDLRNLSHPEQVQHIVKGLDDVFARPDMLSASPNRVRAVQAPVDVAIITILEEEYEAVYRLLKRIRPYVPDSAEASSQHSWVIGEIDALDRDAPYTVVLAVSPRAGTTAAAIVTKNTMQAFNPRAVLVVGIAGGLGGLRPGDVVVADRIYAYEYGKIGSEFHPRDDLDTRADTSIVALAKTITTRFPRWYDELSPPASERRDPPVVPDIKVGHVASGDKVVDDPTNEFFASILRSRPNILAVEMEGVGAATAVQDTGGVIFGMIRGISDLPHKGGAEAGGRPGGAPQSETRDSWKSSASSAAATVTVLLIKKGWPLAPRQAAS